MKSYQHKNEYELFLEAPGKKRVDLKIISASYETVTALVPHDTAPGQYALKLVHRYGRVEREFSRLDVKVETN